MEQDILKRLEEQEKKIDLIYASVEKTRSYFLWTMILSIVFFVLPLVGIMFAVPFLMSTLSTAYGL